MRFVLERGFPSPLPLPPRGGESSAFTHSAARLAGFAGAVLGWRADEFWGATPAELAAVLGAMAPAEGAGMSSGELGRLIEMFPDAAEAGEGPLHHPAGGPPPRASSGRN
jgi:hypothetical protein